MRDLALFLILLPMFGLAFRYAYVGILLWVWSAIISPNELLWGFMADVPLGKITFVITALALIFNRVPINARFDRTFVTILLFSISATVSALTNIAGDTINWDLYSKLIKMLVLALLIFNVMTTRVRIHAVIWAICLALAFHGSTQGLMYLKSGGGHLILGVLSIGDNNSFALAMLMVLPFLFYLYRYSVEPLAKYGVALGIPVCVVSVIGTNSRGGLMGLLVIALMAVSKSKRKLPAVAAIIVGGILLYAFAPDSWFERMDTIKSASDDSSFMGRVIAWKLSTLVALDNPLFGGGFHAIQNMPVWLRYTTNFPLLDFIPTDAPDAVPHAAHSIYFEVLGDLGFGGFFLFVTTLVFGFLNTRAVKRLAKDQPDLLWAYDLANMIQITLTVYCVCGALLSNAYFEPLYIVLGLLARLRFMIIAARTPPRKTFRGVHETLPAVITAPPRFEYS